ncbi:MAG: LPS-assembly protein LptD [Bacteroidales bacterium]|nr:LPS-assembly protein LptD [Bacteroidales bacterium]
MINKLSTKLSTAVLIKVIVLLAIIINACFPAAAQDTLRQNPPDTLNIVNDTISVDTIATDTVIYFTSPNAIKSRVDYTAKDSIRLDMKAQKVYMYSEDDISYEDINLKADYVEIEFKNNTIYATGLTDTAGNETGKPVFTMGNNSFESKSIKYNYETKKGLVQKVITEDNAGFLHGATVKNMPDKVTYIYKGKYTTCDHEDPHFEFRFKKAKAIPDNKIVTGPAYLVIEDVPTPLFIPFGMFPNKKGQRSGIVIPSWGESTKRGFYFENGGYYFAINDYLDLKLVGDIYTLGSWAIKPSLNYRKRYKYNGYFNANYAINILGEEGSPDYSRNKDFSVRWIHNQDPKARPNSKFSANVNIVSSKYNKFNPVNTNAYLSNTFQSSINYSTSWAGKYHLNATINQSQNTITRELDLTLPSITFTVNRFYPFRQKVSIGKPKWYENIGVNYNMNAENRISTYDTLLFKQSFSEQCKNGMKHSVQVSSGSIKILKHIVWTNNFNYIERWYSQHQIKKWSNDTLVNNEVPVYGYVKTDTTYGFNAVRDFSFSTSMSTTMYGMFAYKKGPVKAIRHVLRPSVSFSIRPDFSTPGWGYYKYYYDDNGEIEKYSIYDGFIYGTAPEGKSGNIGFRLSNNLEMKVRSRKDTVTGTKKIVLIEDFSLSTSYDLARDSLNLNRLSLSGRTTLFKKLIINYSSSFDPYALDSLGRRINKFEWDVNKRLFRQEKHNWSVGLTLRLNSDLMKKGGESTKGTEHELKDTMKGVGESTQETEHELEDVMENIEGYVDWSIPWTLNISYNLNYSTAYTYKNGYWNYDITKNKNLIQTLSFSGDINITPKWKLGFRSGYDFENNDFTYTSIDIYRDLHCWEMRFNWIPMGWRQSWNFSINIKSSILQDLKLDKKKDFRDY